MKDLAILVIVIILGLVVQRFVLPKFKNKIQTMETELQKRKLEK